ncbi:MAG: hypothetical protein ABIK81_03515 [candidate division WOR-3 bacterium]
MAVGRFQVMALLQAARAYCLGMSLNEAKSWGLNRAIFYASAKPQSVKPNPGIQKAPNFKLRKGANQAAIKKSYSIYTLGDEMVYSIKVKREKLFTIGKIIQTPEDFTRQVESHFARNFPKAWEEAVKICQEYEKKILLSQKSFYEKVYKPRRDELVKKWSEL